MSKTFEPKTFDTAHHDNKILKVDALFDNPRLLIKEFDGDARGFAFEPSDAPALALAILEAAGVTPFTHDNPVIYNGSWLESIAADLKELTAHQKRATAEAEAQAKLEAEALELYKAHTGYTQTKFLGEAAAPDRWLAVARRAQEMRAEK